MSQAPDGEWVYAGFWIRVWASIIDSALLLIVLFPLLEWIFGPGSSQTDVGQLYTASGQTNGEINWAALSISWPGPLDFILYWLLPAAIVVLFWRTRKATPGKMAIHARIVDARTGNTPSSRQLIIRYAGYYLSTLPLCLGLIWVGIDARKQGWHDKLARTVVIRPRAVADGTARFEQNGSDDNTPHSQASGWNHD